MQLEVGNIVEGKVTGITKFGAFIELPGGKTGMVHISEVSTTYVKEISDHLSENQMVKVKVLSISEDGKISLSIKKTQEAPPQQPQARPAFSQQRPPFQPRQDRQGQDRQGHDQPPRRNTGGRGGNVGWNPKKAEPAGKPTFEDMLAKFKQTSDDKMSDIKKGTEVRRTSRRGPAK